MVAQFVGFLGALMAAFRFDAGMLPTLPACAGRGVAYYPLGSGS